MTEVGAALADVVVGRLGKGRRRTARPKPLLKGRVCLAHVVPARRTQDLRIVGHSKNFT